MQALVVDDSRAMRLIVSRILKELGFEVVEASHGQEAIERLQTAPAVELALVDWNMPVMNGLELVTALRAEARWAAMPVLMVTTENEAGMIQQALDAGVTEFVMKPFTSEILKEKLAMIGVSTEASDV